MEKSELEKRKRLMYIGGFVITALCVSAGVNLTLQKVSRSAARRAEDASRTQQAEQAATASFLLQEASKRQAAEEHRAAEEKAVADERKSAQEAAAEHARFLERHLNAGFVKKPGLKTVGLAVSCDGKMHHGLDATLLDRFKGESVQMLPSFFTSEFVSDGLFDGAFTGSKEVFTKLDLAKYVDWLVLAREQVEYTKNPDLQNVITATIQLEVTSLSVPGNALAQTWSFVANGAGFKQPEARALAEERLAKQIAKDTKMSLPP